MSDCQAVSPNHIQPSCVPRINRPFRLQWEDAQKAFVLLYPEGMVKLNGSAGEVMSRCDGKTSVQEIINDLSLQYPEAEAIEQDILDFLADAFGRRWLIS